MTLRLENGEDYEPKDSDPVTCDVHGCKTTWGALDPYQQLAVEEGLDIEGDICILSGRL